MNETTKERLVEWAARAAVRSAKTAAQSALGTIGASVAMGDVNWPLVGSAALLAAIVSVLTSLAGVPEVEGGASVAKIAKEA